MKRAVLLTMCMAVWASLCLQGSPILITNAGFESDNLSSPPGSFTSNTFAAGWICTPGVGVNDTCGAQNNTPGQYASFGSGITDGVNFAYSNGGTISQTLAANLTANTLYTLTVAVGQKLGSGFPGYIVELLANNQVIAFDNTLHPAAGQFLLDTITFNTSTIACCAANSALSIKLIGASGAQTDFDKVALDATAVVPEPGTEAFFLIGLALICVPRVRSFLAGR
jgi:hypothetical protein